MRGELVTPERLIGALASRQHNVVTRAQLRKIGLSEGAIDRRVRTGFLVRIHRGVYAVVHAGLTREGRYMAAVLACGEGAALSHHSAAVVWEWVDPRGARIHVTVPTPGGRAHRGLVVVHRSPLGPEDVTIKKGIPVTTPRRVLIDMADVTGRRELERLFDEAAYRGHHIAGLRPIPGRRGSGLLSRVIADHEPGTTRTRSPHEEGMLALCRQLELPVPAVNVLVEGQLVDFAWPEARLIVETDGWQAHGVRTAFERDRWRDGKLTAAGWRVMRITWRQLERDAAMIADRMRQLLAAPAPASRGLTISPRLAGHNSSYPSRDASEGRDEPRV